MEGIQPTLPVGGYGEGFGGASGIWLFAILALMWGGNGFGGRYNNAATVEDLNTTSNFSRMESQVRSNADLVERKSDVINSGICNIGYTMAEKFGETNALIIAENQKTRDLIQQNKIEALQCRINQLELNQALNGVVRYPNGMTYNAGQSPFCSCNCPANI